MAVRLRVRQSWGWRFLPRATGYTPNLTGAALTFDNTGTGGSGAAGTFNTNASAL